MREYRIGGRVVGSGKWKVGSWKWEVESWKWVVGSWKWGGGRRWEMGGGGIRFSFLMFLQSLLFLSGSLWGKSFFIRSCE